MVSVDLDQVNCIQAMECISFTRIRPRRPQLAAVASEAPPSHREALEEAQVHSFSSTTLDTVEICTDWHEKCHF